MNFHFDELPEELYSPHIATLDTEELVRYRKLAAELEALEVATDVTYEDAEKTYRKRMEMWDHLFEKYELLPHYPYVVNIHTGTLQGGPIYCDGFGDGDGFYHLYE